MTSAMLRKPTVRFSINLVRVASVLPAVLCVVLIAVAMSFMHAVQANPRAYERLANDLAQSLEQSEEFHGQLTGYQAVFRRDPMRPLINQHGDLVSSTGLQQGLLVQGIIWSEENPLAVIDDELFKEGDAVGPYTIVEIQTEGLIAQHGGEPMFIPLERGAELKLPAHMEQAAATNEPVMPSLEVEIPGEEILQDAAESDGHPAP